MIDYVELMRQFAVPRPNGSAAMRATAAFLRNWLSARQIPYQTHTFRLYPYFNEVLGCWLPATATLLLLATALRWPAWTLLLVGASMLAGILNVARGWPLLTWPGACRGENILVMLGPDQTDQTIILATHYDSKTELLDHVRQGFLLRHLGFCIKAALLVLLVGLIDRLWLPADAVGTALIWGGSLLLLLPAFYIIWGIGLNLLPGRFIRQSQGAVDNGAACVILLGLAARLAHRPAALQRTRVILAFFTGEEVSMQGSRAYVRDTDWTQPTIAINLELLGQDGPYVTWQREGNALTSVPTTARLTTAVAALVADVTGTPVQRGGGINSDGYSFLAAGIPTCVLGSCDRQMGSGGLHRPTDNLERVVLARLPESVTLLERIVQQYDAGKLL
ncbi:MAG: M28 family metallopeptidase [Chloroflexaceae bacterium]